MTCTRVLAFLAQRGAGLYIDDGGVANLEGCNVHGNVASGVRTHMLNLIDLSSSAPLN